MGRNDIIAGCLLGVALGDALGAPHEGGPAERLLWRAIGRTRRGDRRWTDDTQMTLDVAESLLEYGGIDLDAMARRFAASYHWSRGYGPGAARILKRIRRGMDWRTARTSVYPDGSYGNGGAMRSPLLGVLIADDTVVVRVARDVAGITHAHPLGREGAALVAIAAARATRGEQGEALLESVLAVCTEDAFRERLETAVRLLGQGAAVAPRAIARQLGNGIAALDSSVTAIYCAMRFLNAPFPDMLLFIRRVGGDVDSIGAIAGGIWGAANGADALPADLLDQVEQRDRLRDLALRLSEFDLPQAGL